MLNMLASVFSLGSILFSLIIGYNIVTAVVPGLLTLWWMSVVFLVLGIITKGLADLTK